MMALHVWSLAHGIASLFGRGDAGRRKLPMSAMSCWRPACWFTCVVLACRRVEALPQFRDRAHDDTLDKTWVLF